MAAAEKAAEKERKWSNKSLPHATPRGSLFFARLLPGALKWQSWYATPRVCGIDASATIACRRTKIATWALSPFRYPGTGKTLRTNNPSAPDHYLDR